MAAAGTLIDERSEPDLLSAISPHTPPQNRGDDRFAFWRSYLRLGNGLLAAESAMVVLYLWMTRSQGPRGGMSAIAMASVAAGAVPFIFAGHIAAKPWRDRFALTWTLLSGVVLAILVHLDGGMDSPLVGLTALPIMYAALALRPRAVVACGLAGVGALIWVGLTDPDILLPRQNLLMLCAVIGGVAVLALVASVNRSRLEDREARLLREQTELADTDGLTGCLNHRAFSRRLDAEVNRAVRHGFPLSLLIADVDLLKDYNDTHGHQAGDTALRAVGRALRTAGRGVDVSGRVGGDEFAILLPDTSLADARAVATRIARGVSDARAGVTVSIGAAVIDPACPTARHLFRDADAAMYQAKASGRGGVGTTARADGSLRGVPQLADNKRLQDRLRLSERETVEALTILETLQSTAPVGFGFVDRDCRILRLNSMLAAINGGSLESQIGRTVAEVIPRIWPQVEPLYRHVLDTGEPVLNVEVRGDMADDPGRSHYWLGSYYPVSIDDDVVGVGVVVVDITERKEWEQGRAKLTHSAVAALAAAAEIRDPYTAGHQRRVAEIAGAVATELGLDTFTVEGIELAASIHDIGKLAVPAEILARPGRLSAAEMELIRGHSEAGRSILATVDFPWPVADMVAQHHERVDGSGYPHGLRGDEITIGARIIAVADVVEAMASHRPYRPAKGLDDALQELERGREVLYDADVIDVCLRLFRDGRLTLRTDAP